MKKKTFDCVQMKREGARRVYEQIKDMTLEQEIEYWRQRSEEFRREQEELTWEGRRGQESSSQPPA